jgi:hypothetical protein
MEREAASRMQRWRSGGKSATTMGKEGRLAYGRKVCLVSARAREVEGARREIVTTPPEIILYYRLNHSIWSLSDNKEASY